MNFESCCKELCNILTLEQRLKIMRNCKDVDTVKMLLQNFRFDDLNSVKELLFEPKYCVLDEMQPVVGAHVVKQWTINIKREPEYAHLWYNDILQLVFELKERHKNDVILAMKEAGLHDLLNEYIDLIKSL